MMSESLRDRVARVLTEHTIYAPLMSDFECSCGFEADDNNAVEVTPNEHVADALIAAGLVTEPDEWEYAYAPILEDGDEWVKRSREEADRDARAFPKGYTWMGEEDGVPGGIVQFRVYRRPKVPDWQPHGYEEVTP